MVTHSLHVDAVEPLSVHEGRLVDAWRLYSYMRPVDAADHVEESCHIEESPIDRLLASSLGQTTSLLILVQRASVTWATTRDTVHLW